MKKKKRKFSEIGHARTYSSRFFSEEVPKFVFPKNSMPANAAYQLVHDELDLDANPALNLASFVTTWMEPEAKQLIQENLHKNFIDHDEYPQTQVIHQRCVTMLMDLFNMPDPNKGIGSATIGSSEAIMLSLLAHKWNWKKKNPRTTSQPNIVFGSEVHVCWEKFARYFEVEMRVIPIHKNRYIVQANEILQNVDENTICVGAILGTTYTGQSDPISEINQALVNLKKTKGLNIPIHVDAASGGFILPFTDPKFAWDFRLEQVQSINVSGHKYGLVFPGLGWMLWKEAKTFPEELIFKVNYLGGWMPTYTLNFSCNSINVIAQYYNFLRLGKKGYKNIMQNCLKNAQYLASLMQKAGPFELINKGERLPIVAMKLKSSVKKFSVFDLSHKLREKGWVVSAYTLPKNAEKVAIMRVVVKENFSHDMAEIFFKDLQDSIAYLSTSLKKKRQKKRKEKHHPIC